MRQAQVGDAREVCIVASQANGRQQTNRCDAVSGRLPKENKSSAIMHNQQQHKLTRCCATGKTGTTQREAEGALRKEGAASAAA